MKIELRNNKDFIAGLLFIAMGLVAVVVAQKNYPMGTPLRMGPGYFPAMLGGILIAFGLYVMVRGLIKGGKIKGVFGSRPVSLITLGVVAFGFLMDHFGMVPALLVLVSISAFGGHEFKFREVLILAVILTVVSWVIFIYGLGLPYRLLFWWR